jgi:hypothetical protein
MYRFVTEIFGACNVRRRKQRSSGAALLEIVEIETFYGSSSIVSSYRYEKKDLRRARVLSKVRLACAVTRSLSF